MHTFLALEARLGAPPKTISLMYSLFLAFLKNGCFKSSEAAGLREKGGREGAENEGRREEWRGWKKGREGRRDVESRNGGTKKCLML